MHYGEDFTGDKTIIGSTFFIDRATGKQVKVKIIFYKFNPDSIFNLTQDAEGDATVFDMNGDLSTTEILIGTDGEKTIPHGVFYSIVEDTGTTSTASSYRKFANQEELNKAYKEVYVGQKVVIGSELKEISSISSTAVGTK